MDERERMIPKSNIPVTSETLLRDIGEDPRSRRWAEFVRKYRPMMESFLRKKFRGVEADDIIQETLAALAKALPDYEYNPDENGTFHCYLQGILFKKAVDALKKKQSQTKRDGAYARSRLDSGELATGSEEGSGEDEGAIPVLAVPGDAPGTTREEWMDAVFRIALAELRRERHEDRLWQMFWRTWMLREPTETVMEAFGASRNVVYQTRERLKKRLAEIAEALKNRV